MSPREAVGHLVLQAGAWLLTVWAAGAGHLWWPLLPAAAVLALACWRAPGRWWRVAAIIGLGAACAGAVDGSLSKIALIAYAGGEPGQPLPPAWTVACWMLAAAALAGPARRPVASPVLAGVLGAALGYGAYALARTLGAVATGDLGLAVAAVSTALALPIIVLTANALLPPRLSAARSAG